MRTHLTITTPAGRHIETCRLVTTVLDADPPGR